MRILLVEDADAKAEIATDLLAGIRQVLNEAGHQVEERAVSSADIKACRGCYICWVKTPGQCLLPDALNAINRAVVNNDFVVYLGRVVFGQYAATLKHVLDRSIPNLLPFFESRDGRIQHPRRHTCGPRKILIGYCDGNDPEEIETFMNVARKRTDTQNAYVSTSSQNNRQIIDALMKDVGLA